MYRLSAILAAGLLICAMGNSAKATGDSLRYLNPTDTVFLELGPFGEKYGVHYVERKQTLFSLAQFYGLSLNQLYLHNPNYRKRSPSLGKPVRYPIPNKAIKRFLRIGMDFREFHAPIYYRVKKGDTMYRLSRIYFRMPVEVLLERAGLESHTQLKPGQLIHIGWLAVDGIPKEDQAQQTYAPVPIDNQGLQQRYDRQLNSGKTAKKEKGPAAWKEDPKAGTGYFALHRKAAINSIIEVHNPMLNRWVFAKVIGRISDQAYPDETTIVLSPHAAKMLGAIDQKFFVKVSYFK